MARMKTHKAPMGRMPEYLATLTDDERSRTAVAGGCGLFDDETAKTWPSRAAMLETVRMQSRRERRPDDWRPVVK